MVTVDIMCQCKSSRRAQIMLFTLRGERERETQRETETERQTDRQTDRQRERQRQI